MLTEVHVYCTFSLFFPDTAEGIKNESHTNIFFAYRRIPETRVDARNRLDLLDLTSVVKSCEEVTEHL